MKFKKECAFCGKVFETNSPQKLYCNNPHFRPCPVCGQLVQMIDNDFSRPPKCCSSKCAHELRVAKFSKRKCIFCGEEFIPKSGVQLACNKVHVDKCEICGKEFVRTIANYNDNVTTCSHECTVEKLKRASLAKYGTEHPMQSKLVQKNFHAAMFAKYGVAHALQIPGKIEQQQQAAVSTNLERWGVAYACLTPNCVAAHRDLISKINKAFNEKLIESNLCTEFEKRIETKSFDIHVVGTNTLIELDPTYTHNTIGNHYMMPVDKNYHKDKTALAESAGYRCIHVFDWDDWDKVINIIKPIERRIYARKCSIYKINKDVGDKFLVENHIQGACRGQLLYLGLVYEGELVQLMTFGKPRYDKSYDVELLRLCTLSGVQVVGGASKLFHYATSVYELHNIISYCDRAKFRGDVYKSIGMRLDHVSPPQEVWSKNKQHITANLLRARGYDQLFGTNYGKGTDNEELMLKDGWLPVYDCGQAVYVYD